jgi:hypothetical protein
MLDFDFYTPAPSEPPPSLDTPHVRFNDAAFAAVFKTTVASVLQQRLANVLEPDPSSTPPSESSANVLSADLATLCDAFDVDRAEMVDVLVALAAAAMAVRAARDVADLSDDPREAKRRVGDLVAAAFVTLPTAILGGELVAREILWLAGVVRHFGALEEGGGQSALVRCAAAFVALRAGDRGVMKGVLEASGWDAAVRALEGWGVSKVAVEEEEAADADEFVARKKRKADNEALVGVF